MTNIRNRWLDVFFLLVIQQYKCDGSTSILEISTINPTNSAESSAINLSVTSVSLYISKSIPTSTVNLALTATGKITRWVKLI